MGAPHLRRIFRAFLREPLLFGDNVPQVPQKPRVDVRRFVQLLNRQAHAQRLRKTQEPLRRGFADGTDKRILFRGRIAVKLTLAYQARLALQEVRDEPVHRFQALR